MSPLEIKKYRLTNCKRLFNRKSYLRTNSEIAETANGGMGKIKVPIGSGSHWYLQDPSRRQIPTQNLGTMQKTLGWKHSYDHPDQYQADLGKQYSVSRTRSPPCHNYAIQLKQRHCSSQRLHHNRHRSLPPPWRIGSSLLRHKTTQTTHLYTYNTAYAPEYPWY